MANQNAQLVTPAVAWCQGGMAVVHFHKLSAVVIYCIAVLMDTPVAVAAFAPSEKKWWRWVPKSMISEYMCNC